MAITRLIVGLGNPGPQYSLNRHNCGFLFIDKLAENFSFSDFKNKFNSLYINKNLSINNIEYKIFLIKPQNYMNLSGIEIAKFCQFYKIDSKDVVVVYDDIDLKLGDFRFKRGGGSAGHNGIKSLDQYIGVDYLKVRIGVGRPENGYQEVADYVLSDFNQEQLKTINLIFEKILEDLRKGIILMTIIAIDGPSASGKSTIAKILAEKLGFNFLPTGKIFRLIAREVLLNKTTSLEDVLSIAQTLDYNKIHQIDLDSEEISLKSSEIAKLAKLREVTNKVQRDIINKSKNIVVEGRDIATIICPDADYKFFINAAPEIRAERRFKTLAYAVYEDVLESIKFRDNQDMNREVAPLIVSKDAIIIDNSFSLDKAINDIISFIALPTNN